MAGGGLPHPVLFANLLGMDKLLHGYIHIFYTWVAMAFLFTLGFMLRGRIKMVPGGLQNVFEVIVGGLENFAVENIGEKARSVFPVMAVLFIFIATQNLLGLVPGCDAPTANVNTNAAMALFVFVYYNFKGLAKWGPGYIKHFMGPMPAIAPMMLPIEFISHIARPLSLTLRLFGNIRGEEIVLVLLFFLAPVIGTLPMYFLFSLAKIIQAFIFFMLTMLYLGAALDHAH